jgi:tetratricopeptide (TPR) repeat protein
MLLGTSLKAVGRTDEAVAAFRRAIEVGPDHSEAWFMLGEMKTVPYTADDRAALQRLAADSAVKGRDRVFIHFALARSLEDDSAYADAFAHYASGAGLSRSQQPYDPEEFAARRRADEALFTSDFFGSRAEGGDPGSAPIFIVGLPRSGSTLVEQILSSHTAVEGTMELPYLPRIASELSDGRIPALSPAERTAQGEIYLAKAARHRRTDRPFFIDKAPDNFQNIGLIRLILPNAKIIDVRRNPLASGVSLFRQLFRSPGGFTCDLTDIGRRYRDYLDLMRHFDRVRRGASTGSSTKIWSPIRMQRSGACWPIAVCPSRKRA